MLRRNRNFTLLDPYLPLDVHDAVAAEHTHRFACRIEQTPTWMQTIGADLAVKTGHKSTYVQTYCGERLYATTDQVMHLVVLGAPAVAALRRHETEYRTYYPLRPGSVVQLTARSTDDDWLRLCVYSLCTILELRSGFPPPWCDWLVGVDETTIRAQATNYAHCLLYR